MQLSHGPSAVLDDPNPVSVAEVVPVLARRAGLHDLATEHPSVPGQFRATTTTATIRAHLIAVPARVARSARPHVLPLPDRWPWQHAWAALHAAAAGPPATATT